MFHILQAFSIKIMKMINFQNFFTLLQRKDLRQISHQRIHAFLRLKLSRFLISLFIIYLYNFIFSILSLLCFFLYILSFIKFCFYLQVLTILYNFSFETINGMFMSGHNATKRFLLFSGCCKESFIKRTALDTLDNIAEYVCL